MKRKILAIAVIAICLAIVAYGTVAYFTASGVAHNVITSGNVGIELNEWADSDKTTPFPKDGIRGVVPGTDITKIVEVKNTGANPAYVRISVDKAIKMAEGVDTQADTSLMILNFDKDSWTERGGYYYYNEALAPGETTPPLFASVTFDKTMGNDYQNCTATVNVMAYAVQTANNGASSLDAAGWPEA